MKFLHTRFTWPLVLFGLSALLATVLSYDLVGALWKLAFVVGGLAVYVAVSTMPALGEWRGRERPFLQPFVASTPAIIAFYFVLTNDWNQPVDKIAWLEPVRVWLAAYQPSLPLPHLSPNVVGGVLAMWLPLQIAALASRRNPDAPSIADAFRGTGLILAGATVAGLVASGLRGAWLALVVTVALRFAVNLRGRLTSGGVHPVSLALSIAALGAILFASSLFGSRWLAQRPDRLLVWLNSWQLAWEYPFTGLGLGGFTMPYSSYAMLLHVPYATHAHNLFLDLWLEQGVLGLTAFVWLVVLAFIRSPLSSTSAIDRRHTAASLWREAGCASLLVVVVHGMIDDVYYGYGGTGALVLFLPVAILARDTGHSTQRYAGPVLRTRLAVAGIGCCLVFVALLVPSIRAFGYVNLAALRQTRVELSVFRWPEWPIQDAVRRSFAKELVPAVEAFDRALALDPTNPEASRRLGQIELSLGEFERARAHLETAFRQTPDHEGTRQLFGESLAVTGEPERAAETWQALRLEENQLALRQWWYENGTDPQRAQWINEAIQLAARR